MKLSIFVLLMVGFSSLSVLRAARSKECNSFKTALDDIHNLLDEEAENHGLDLEGKGGRTYVSRTEYILTELNSKIAPKRKKNPESNANCRSLEVEILTKSKEYGIEKIGLENDLTRLRKVFTYQDDRYMHQLHVLEESKNQTQACEDDRLSLEGLVQTLNVTNSEQAKTIKQLKEQLAKQEKKYQTLAAKINANAPAIHGGTGTHYGDGEGRANGSTEAITLNSTSLATTESVPDSESLAADIDLRSSS